MAVSRRSLRAVLGAAVLLVLWAAAAPLLAGLLVSERNLENADAILILSGAADHRQRAEGGAMAFRQGLASRILLTNDGQRGGWDDAEKGNPFFVERTRRILIEQGVPSENIETLSPSVHSTADEAGLAVRTAAARNYKRIIIVTSDFHSRRALWTFDRAALLSGTGLEIGLSRSPSGPRYPGRTGWWLSFRGWRTVGAEYLKFAYYWTYSLI